MRPAVPRRILLLLGLLAIGTTGICDPSGQVRTPNSETPLPAGSLEGHVLPLRLLSFRASDHGLAGCAEPPFETASPKAPAPYAEVAIATTRTSIYVGSVSLTMPPFQRQGATFRSTYVCKVFPFFFYGEKGRLQIEVPDADLDRLAAGETITFSGEAENSLGKPRRIEGRAVPTSPLEGKIKVRVFVSPKIELIFNTTYHFPSTPTPAAAAAATSSPRPGPLPSVN